MSTDDSNNDRQPKMAAETGNTYTSETIRDTTEIPTANLGFTTILSSTKVSANDCNNGRQLHWKTAMWLLKPEILISLELRQIRHFRPRRG